MFEFNLQTAVFFGTVALGVLLFALAVMAFIGVTVLLGTILGVQRTTEAAGEKVRSQRTGSSR